MKIVLAVALLVAALGLAGCGGQPAAPGPTPVDSLTPAGSAQEFVGRVEGTNLAVALVLGGPNASVEAYACDGTGASELFAGATQGDHIQLRSTDGDSTLDVNRTAEGFTGTVQFAGQNRPFTVVPAQGVSGLYDLVPRREGDKDTFVGRSFGGNQWRTENVGDRGSRGTITVAGGQIVPWDHTTGAPPETLLRLAGFSAYRVVVPNDGRPSGSPKATATRSASGGSYTCRDLFP